MPVCLYCCYISTKEILDPINGIREFSVRPREGDGFSFCGEKGLLRCKGQTRGQYKYTPLKLYGEMSADENGQYLDVQSCTECFPDRASAIGYLTGSLFKGIGPVKAEKIVDALGFRLYEAANREDAAEIFMTAGRLGEAQAVRCVNILRQPSSFRQLAEYLQKHGGTFGDAETLYSVFREDAIRYLKRDPYGMLDYGLSLSACDAVAENAGIHYLDRDRIRAFVRDALKRRDGSGDSYIPFGELCRIINRRYGGRGTISPLHIAAACAGENAFCRLSEEGHVRVYQKELYDAERLCAARIAKYIRTARIFPTEKIDIRKIEEKLGISYAPKQAEAFKLLGRSGIALLIGGPGMGKTTLEKGFIEAFRQMYPGASVALCAPTAAAAKRMREATGFRAETIHRMLGIRPGHNGHYAARDEHSVLPYELIIADECSMIDTRLFTMLIRALGPGSLLIMVGDDGQLASVGSGNVLRDLIGDGRIPTCRLDTYFRQNGDSVIVRNGQKIRNGETDLTEDESFCIVRVHSDEEMRARAIGYMSELYDPDDPKKCRLYTTARQHRFMNGTESLNGYFQERYRSAAPARVRRGNTVLCVGDPVVFTCNNYDAGYMNGDEGVIRSIEDEPGRECVITVDTDDGTLEIRGKEMRDIEPSYALTVHKAQGSECDTAIILLPKEPSSLLSRNLTLVAATRARKRNIIITEGDALEQSIMRKNQTERRTGLRLRLQESLGEKTERAGMRTDAP